MAELAYTLETGWKRHPVEYIYFCDICHKNTKPYFNKRTGKITCGDCAKARDKARAIERAKERDTKAIDIMVQELKKEFMQQYDSCEEDWEIIDRVANRVKGEKTWQEKD